MVIMKKIYDRHRHFVLYVIIGTAATAVDMSIFFVLSGPVGFYYLTANIISVFIGIIISYELNSRYNFKKTSYRTRRLISFFAVCLTGMIATSLLLTIFYIWMDFPKFTAKIISAVIAGILQFFFNKNITFKK